MLVFFIIFLFCAWLPFLVPHNTDIKISSGASNRTFHFVVYYSRATQTEDRGTSGLGEN